jgi:hypothetical protein
MAGLSLRTGFAAGGTYTPMTPSAANSPSARTIGQQAYGISGTGTTDQRPVAAYGSISVGVLALAALVYIWWSLPR